ncbi:MAG TPA: UDP-N-acetylmuramoyl-L-alanine--D-glutamate ligase, partial [Candidatus Obscuribacterales bacterium]
MSNWAGKKVTILGLGRSGVSSAMYLKQRGAQVLISEKSALDAGKEAEAGKLRKQGIEVESGEHSEKAIKSADLIIISPGIPPSSEVVQRAHAQGKEVICDIELAYRERGKTQIIGITGTNGKSTTCALTSYILEHCDLTAPACGNFGIPILSQLESNPDYLVAEVSSYQLHYCPAFAPIIGVWLNLTPDHIEWHGGIAGYIADKKKMFLNQREDQYAVLNQDDEVVAEFKPPSEIFPFAVHHDMESAVQGAFLSEDFLCYRIDGATKVLCGRDELKIIGDHNVENALAALSVAALLHLD